MGHQRLGWLPDTYPWRDVVALVAADGAVAEVADATMDAARRGLAKAIKDPGVRHVIWLLAHVAVAARADDFAVELRGLGVPVPAHPTTFELIAAVTAAVDDHLAGTGGRTDFGELAQRAAAESLAVLVGTNTPELFEPTPRSVQKVVYGYSTQNGFGTLAADFFGRLTRGFLEYHLSRELSMHVGRGRRFADVHAHGRFREQLDWSCREAAHLVRAYAGEWYSKAKFLDGVSPRQVGTFVETSFNKLREELRHRGQRRPAGKGAGHAA